jgi:glycosyltransferase
LNSIKISVITVVYNNAFSIEEAILSVLSQSYNNIEYIVIDGNSLDGTVNIVKKYSEKISKFLSEPDNGIYDALNKGVELATGDVICFLHSDDIYANRNVILNIANEFVNDITVDGVYGDLVYVAKNDTSRVCRHWKSKYFYMDLLKQGWMPPHPTLFLRKKIYERFGKFDLDFKIAADYDFLLRVLSGGIKVKYLPKILYKMRLGGESNKSIVNILRKSKEDLGVLRKNNIGGLYTLMCKNISKVSQLFFMNKNV